MRNGCWLVMAWIALGVSVGCTRPKAAAHEAARAGEPSPAAAVAEAAAIDPPLAATRSGAAAANFAQSGAVRAVTAVATVNGREIAADKFNAEFDHMIGKGARIPPDRLRRIATNILNKLVESELRAQAIEREHIELTEPEFEDTYKEFTSRFVDAHGHFDEAAFQGELTRSRLTVEQLRRQLREQRLQKKLVEKLGRVDVSEPDLKAFYEANPSAWVEAASRDVRPILIRVQPDARPEEQHKAEAQALEASKVLRKGGDFEQIARQFGEAPLPPIHIVRGSGDPELEKAAFALKVGEVSAPVKTRWGLYVVRLIEKNDQRERPYSEVREEIQRTLGGRRLYLEDRRIVGDLRKKADVVEKLPF